MLTRALPSILPSLFFLVCSAGCSGESSLEGAAEAPSSVEAQGTPSSASGTEGEGTAVEEEPLESNGGAVEGSEGHSDSVSPGDTAIAEPDTTGSSGGESVSEEGGEASVSPPECDTSIAELAPPYFADISSSSGIQKNNYVSMPGASIPINDHSRLAFADLNGDRLDDIVMHSLYPNPQNGIPFEHLVFLNNGDGTFTDFSDESGLRYYQVGFFAFGDLDNDGDQDIFGGLDIGLGSPHEILLNDGTGRFLAKKDSGLEGEWNTIAGNALLADFNGDAILDLYIGNGHTTSAAPDSYWLGNGDGSFFKATSALQATLLHPSNGLVACDYDADGDLDIFVSTYGVSQSKGHNILWENQGNGTFQNVAQQRGFHAQEGGNTFLEATAFGATPEGVPVDQWMGSNGFGLACEDINGDGFLDIFLATISHPVATDYNRKWSDPSQVLINQGPAEGFRFVNEATSLGLPFNEGDIDAAAVDFDNDGRIDLALTRDNKYEKYYEGLEQKAWFGLYHQQPSGSFTSSIQNNGINGLDIVLQASLNPCESGDECPGAEICHNNKCRTACTSNQECSSPNEICHPGGFCKGLGRMKKGQNQSWADIDRDGDLDLLVGGRDTGGGRPNFLFRNDVGNTRRWIGLDLEGDGISINRDAIGAQVRVQWEGGIHLRTVQGSRGTYNSADGRSILVGLAEVPCSFTIQIQWPNGETASFEPGSLAEGTYHRIQYPDILLSGDAL